MSARLVHLDGQVYVDPARVVALEPLDPLDPSKGTLVWAVTPTDNLKLSIPEVAPAEVAAKLAEDFAP